MKFGILKSKIETLLTKSYSKNTFKKEMSFFKTHVLENKNISKLYYLYDDLNSNKGLDKTIVESYVNESISMFNNISKKIKPEELEKLKTWVKDVKSDNQYSHIDNLFSNSILTLESKINSKKFITESLTKSPKVTQESLNVPIKTLVSIANKSITNHVNNLSESDRRELVDLLSQDDKKLSENFQPLKDSVISKLTILKRETTDYETGKKINETIEKIQSEEYDKLSYYKLKGLNDNL